ncbi:MULTISPECIES: hypothetical protein [unclassified Agrococcus]|uniref:hypothetical protein n=1 Tax=unclassified Agrococcus TaxID=2615065 RepID=UPI0036113A6A
MSIPLPDYFKPHTVSVRDRVDGGGMGPGYGDPRDVRGFVVDEQKVVVTASGVEAVSSSQVHTDADELVPPQSLVTIWVGTPFEREAAVVAITRGEHPTLPGFQTLALE